MGQSWTSAEGRWGAVAAESEHPTERRWTPERLGELAEVYLRALALGVAAKKDWLDRLQRKRARRSGKPLCAQTVRNTLNLLRVCFQDAMDRGLIEQNPARDLRLNRSTSATTEEPWTYLEPGEQQAFLDAMPADERRYYAFALGTGLRPGEQRALRVDDVRLDGEAPYVP